MKTKKNYRGFTLIELLVTIAILGMLIILTSIAWRNQLNKARDAQRKADLERIKIAFEDYYNDKGCFPPENILQICNGNELNPYLQDIPCDPVFNLPYCYIHDEADSCGQSYKVLAPLKNSSDPIIKKLFCDDSDLYCGYEQNCASLINPPSGSDYSGFNYGVTSSNTQLYNPDATPPATPNPSTSPGSSPSPSPSASTGPVGNYNYACQPPTGNCNNYADPIDAGCPVWNAQDEVCSTGDCCLGRCTDTSNWCTNY